MPDRKEELERTGLRLPPPRTLGKEADLALDTVENWIDDGVDPVLHASGEIVTLSAATML